MTSPAIEQNVNVYFLCKKKLPGVEIHLGLEKLS